MAGAAVSASYSELDSAVDAMNRVTSNYTLDQGDASTVGTVIPGV